MDYFQDLLDSYQKIKQRKFKLTISEGKEDIFLNLFGFSSNKDIVANSSQIYSRVISTAKKVNDKAQIPPGTTNLYSDPKGNIWFYGPNGPEVLFYGPSKKNPSGGSTTPFALNSFKGLFQDDMNTQVDAPPQPMTQDPAQSNPQDPMASQGMEMAPTDPEIAIDLMRIHEGVVDLLKTKKFFSGNTGWMDPGPDEQYLMVGTKIMGAPGSLEFKLTNAKGIDYDPITNAPVYVPLNTEDKKIAVKLFKDFIQRATKFERGTFTEDDATWISTRLIRDRNGLWLKDPILLNYGITFSWSKSPGETMDSFFTNLLESYNKSYTKWAHENNTEPNHLIPEQDFRRPNWSGNYGELNNIRGKSAEQLGAAIHALWNGDRNTFSMITQQVIQEYGNNLSAAFMLVQEFKTDMAIGTEQTVELMNFISNLTKISGQADINGVIKKLVVLETKSSLLRNPLKIEALPTNNVIGMKADQTEFYTTIVDAHAALAKNGFDTEDIQDLAKGKRVNVGLKTYLTPTEVQAGLTNIDNIILTLRNPTPFSKRVLQEFGIGTDIDLGHYSVAVNELEKIHNVVNTSLSKVNIPKTSPTEARKIALTIINNYARVNFGYYNLLDIQDLQKYDNENDDYINKVKSLVLRKIVARKIKKNVNPNPNELDLKTGTLSEQAVLSKSWRALLAVITSLTACSDINQISNIRFLSNMESLVINHNRSIYDPLKLFIAGELNIDNDLKSDFRFYDKSNNTPFILKQDRYRHKGIHNTNLALCWTVPYLRSIAKKPINTIKESLIEKYLDNQRLILNQLLKK